MIKYIPEVCTYSDECRMTGGCKQNNLIRQGQEEHFICDHWDRSVMHEHDELVERAIMRVKRWNECISKIPQIDEYNLKGIKHWKVFQFDLQPNDWGDDFSWEGAREEVHKIAEAGFNIGFNTDHGVGKIIDNEDGTFTIKLCVYRVESNPLENVSIEEALGWVKEFYGDD